MKSYVITKVGIEDNNLDAPLLPTAKFAFFLRTGVPDFEPPGGVEIPEPREELPASTLRLKHKI